MEEVKSGCDNCIEGMDCDECPYNFINEDQDDEV